MAGQLHITRWFVARWEAGHSLITGVMVLAISFVPLAVFPASDRLDAAAAVAALIFRRPYWQSAQLPSSLSRWTPSYH